jgi:hypothetical protein
VSPGDAKRGDVAGIDRGRDGAGAGLVRIREWPVGRRPVTAAPGGAERDERERRRDATAPAEAGAEGPPAAAAP